MAKKVRKPKKEISSFDLDEAFVAATEEAKKLFPNRVYTGSEESMRCICLPVPALAVRYLLQQEGWPLGRFVLLDGPQESCKSAFSYEIIRWHRLARGKGIIIEVEDKRSPELCQSILNYDAKAVEVHRCETMEEWNSALTYWMDTYKIIMDGDPKAPKSRPGKGRLIPVAFVVDSIMSAVVEGVMTNIEKEGHTEKRYALEASHLNDFMKVVTKWLSDYPFSFIGINHIKPGQDKYGNPVRKMPGGKAPGYHASLDIEMNRTGRHQWKMADGTEGISLRMDVQKNSCAPHASIEVDMIWRIDIENPTASGECLQRTYFDWNTASILCLNKVIDAAGREHKKRLIDICELHCIDKTQRVWCPQLGISEKSPVSFQEGGEILEKKLQEDSAFRDALYPLMGIRRRPIYKPLVEFREQMEEARQAAIKMQRDRESIFVKDDLDSPPIAVAASSSLLDKYFDDDFNVAETRTKEIKEAKSPVDIG